MGEGLELGVGVGGASVALHHRQVLVVAIGVRKRTGLRASRRMAQLDEKQVRSRWLSWAESRCWKRGTPTRGLAWRIPVAPRSDGLPPPPGDSGLAGVGEVHQSAASALRRRRSPASLGPPGFT